jgi:hypothetical protein
MQGRKGFHPKLIEFGPAAGLGFTGQLYETVRFIYVTGVHGPGPSSGRARASAGTSSKF